MYNSYALYITPLLGDNLSWIVVTEAGLRLIVPGQIICIPGVKHQRPKEGEKYISLYCEQQMATDMALKASRILQRLKNHYTDPEIRNRLQHFSAELDMLALITV